MIKIVASVELDDGRKKTCSYQSKENKQLTLVDVNRVWKFVAEAVENGYKPQVNWKITYDQKNTHSIISGMSSKFLVISLDRGIHLINNMINSINSNIKNIERW